MIELDSTAGYRMMWRDRDTHDIIFIDIRSDVRPNIVGDARHLPFRDNIFKRIWFDPPFWIRKSKIMNLIRQMQVNPDLHKVKGRIGRLAHQFQHYGVLRSRTEYINLLYYTNKEFRRVLTKDGTVVFKTLSHPTNHREIPGLNPIKELWTNFLVMEDKQYPSKSHNSSAVTHWLTMKPNGNNLGELSNHD